MWNNTFAQSREWREEIVENLNTEFRAGEFERESKMELNPSGMEIEQFSRSKRNFKWINMVR